MERGRPMPSGTTVSGKMVRFCNANTATSKGSPFPAAENRKPSVEAVSEPVDVLSGFCAVVGVLFSRDSGIN
jgi:hypothetical protein